MTLVLKSRVASDGAFGISFTNVYFHGNFGHCLGCESCPLGARCLPQVGTVLTQHGQACCAFPDVFVILANDRDVG